MVFYPGAARKHAVAPMRNRTRSGALVPAAVGESDPRYGPATQRVSFVNNLAYQPIHHTAKRHGVKYWPVPCSQIAI